MLDRVLCQILYDTFDYRWFADSSVPVTERRRGMNVAISRKLLHLAARVHSLLIT